MDHRPRVRPHPWHRLADHDERWRRRVDGQLGRMGHNPPSCRFAWIAAVDSGFPRLGLRASRAVQLAQLIAVPTPRDPQIRVAAMPSDAIAYGGVFGGWLMGQMCLACGSFASRHSAGKAILVAADALKFPGAMAVGDELSVYVELV